MPVLSRPAMLHHFRNPHQHTHHVFHHTPLRIPSWANTLAINAVNTDGHIRLTDLPEKVFDSMAPEAQGVVVIDGRLCITLQEFNRLLKLQLS